MAGRSVKKKSYRQNSAGGRPAAVGAGPSVAISHPAVDATRRTRGMANAHMCLGGFDVATLRYSRKVPVATPFIPTASAVAHSQHPALRVTLYSACALTV
ncbi:hypothetical protein EVAR_51307_1 [Eumeta japonica]|uniref:Uncharacterized protein n=1 Tax=Eumeta variegata TaxID=151549 RepID=A0A4C1XRJ0_EUMVA|nr:hypothetical protein EVAR_51307_1 [Eumeta japonica]